MSGPVWHTPQYQAWLRQMIVDSRETVSRSRELVRRADLLLVATRGQAKRPTDAKIAADPG